MKKAKWLFILLSVMLIASVALAACGFDNDSADSGTGEGAEDDDSGVEDDAANTEGTEDGGEKVVNMTASSEPPDLDSATSTDTSAANVLGNVMEGLIVRDNEGKPVPGMAEDLPEISEDELTYTFHLRDANWSDGTPVTADDFVFAWQKALDPETKSQYAYFLFEIEGAEAYNSGEGEAEDVGVKALDEKTLEVTLNHPVPYFIDKLANPVFFPQKQEFVEEMGDGYAKEDDALLYNGPYKLANWQHEASFEFVKNEEYWNADNINIDKVTWSIVKEATTAVNLYETGEVDVAGLSQDLVDQYQDDEAFTTFPEYVTFYLQFNMEKVDVLKNEKIRAAIAGAIDRETHADVILNNGSTGAYGIVGPGVAGPDGPEGADYRSTYEEPKSAKDIDEAKKLLEEGMEELGLDEPPTLEYLTDDTEAARKTAEYLQEELKKNLGVNLEINMQTFASRLELSREKKYDIAMTGWGVDYNDPLSFFELFTTDSAFNDPGWSNERYDELVELAQTSPDNEERFDAMGEAEQILIEESPIAPLYYRARAFLWSSELEGLIHAPYGTEYDFRWADINRQ